MLTYCGRAVRLRIQMGKNRKMCGIVDAWQNKGTPVSGYALARMNNLLIHWGPDDEGYWTEGNIGLAQQRLRAYH